MKKGLFPLIWSSLKDAFRGFSDHKVTKLSASLAYYTVFSLGPLLIVIIFICGLFLGEEAVQGTITSQLRSFIGTDAAAQVETIIKNAAISDKGGIAAAIGIVTLLIGATTVFGELQDSMNSIWGVKATAKAGLMKLVATRLLSFGMIASLGFLLLVSLAVTTVVESIGQRLQAMLPDLTVILVYLMNLVLTIGVVTLLFAVIFKVLPDVEIRWRHVWMGSIVTALLFLIGKFAISFYISKSNVGSTYGSAGSLVILLLWVYYSSIIIYFGAEFTRAYALHKGAEVKPKKLAQWEEKPAIAGAKPAPMPGSHSPEDSPQHQHPPKPQLLPARAATAAENKTQGSMGKTLLGLAVYFIDSKISRKSRSDK